jgi:hypothetical protein
MAQRSKYWSCIQFADWLRGVPKGGAKTARGWREWNKEASQTHPIRYWIAEEGLDKVQNFLWWPVDKLYDVKYYINNRWVTRTHSLTAHPRDIKPGDWCDVGNRFLLCLFNELVDFIEIEQAWHHIAWDNEAREKFRPPFWASGWFRWRTWRCPDAGLAYLNWAKELKSNEDWCDKSDPNFDKPTAQAINAQEILELYNWWKNIRPLRVDPYEASGWSAYCESRRSKERDIWAELDHDDDTPAQQELTRKMLDEVYRIEKEHEQEDEAMMIRLIKVRNSLWT